MIKCIGVPQKGVLIETFLKAFLTSVGLIRSVKIVD